MRVINCGTIMIVWLSVCLLWGWSGWLWFLGGSERGELTIVGDHWTFVGSGKDDSGKQVFSRTENFFTGRDKIHFEQYESGDNTTWVKKNAGDEVRVQ